MLNPFRALVTVNVPSCCAVILIQHALPLCAGGGGTPGPGMYYVELASKEIDEAPFSDGGRQKVLVNFTDIGLPDPGMHGV